MTRKGANRLARRLRALLRRRQPAELREQLKLWAREFRVRVGRRRDRRAATLRV